MAHAGRRYEGQGEIEGQGQIAAPVMRTTDELPVVELEAKNLPAFCPNRQMSVWNQHPRVFLDVTSTGQVACPYCGTQYRLKPGMVLKGH